MNILGIETSCDETGIAVVDSDLKVLGSALVTQIDLHKKYGGVVPELAARMHSQTIDTVLRTALANADIELKDIDAIAVTYGPGLPGALLVGIAFAKTLAYSLQKPLIPVNHLEAHLESVLIEHKDEIEYPALGLIVSGGHTSLVEVKKPGEYKLLAKTRDDAAGESYDKAAKLLELEYPGGPVIDRFAIQGNPKRFKFKIPKFSDGSNDYSFSGIKTAVLKHINETPLENRDELFIKDIAASFQAVVVKILLKSVERAFDEAIHKSMIITGGVAVNSGVRAGFKDLCGRKGMKLFFPRPSLCTDNGVMVAALAQRLFKEKKLADITLDAKPDLKLG
ncbi:MAG: tRNA (adenosine(37)-N6)-threonylcarbamoyltransferase complex transferase subunit TsaD [Acidobacteria bacterium]|nr:tRNA (adenosine(37)-N6)-threonylcarbamoyltransferase complex transferase subunit TsaD [Acidobacteriota bacterium]